MDVAVSARDRQRVSAGARASPSWIGGRRRPTRRHYAFTERVRKVRREHVDPRAVLASSLCRSDVHVAVGEFTLGPRMAQGGIR